MRGEALLALLVRPLAPAEVSAFRRDADALDARLVRLARGPGAAARLAAARDVASSTLSDRGAAAPRAAFAKANALVARFVQEEAPLSLPRVLELAVALEPRAAGLRAGPASFSGHPCPPPEDLAALLAPMAEHVEARAREVHPVAGAALAQQWLVSAHPFADANGRTARLVADWLLARAGYPPATYPSFGASLNAVVDHGREPIAPMSAALVVLRGVLHTVDLLERT